MSVELVATIITAAGLLATLGGGIFAGFAWMLRRMDEEFAKVDQKLDRMDERINGVQTELTEVKIAVARLEGPRQRLIIPH